MPADADAFLGQREIPHPTIAVIDDELAHNFLQNHSIRRSYQRRPRANDASARASTTETLSLPPAASASSTSRCAAVRSEERSVGNEQVRTCSSRWWRYR